MINDISDVEVVELFRKYEKDIFELLKKKLEDEGYVVEEGKLKKFDLVDEMFCMMIEDGFMESVIENMEDSIGVGEYGIEVVDED